MKNIPLLTLWQKKQAALLYHFASIEYLKELQFILNDTVLYVETILDFANSSGVDKHLLDANWGNRNTAENWANNAWPFFKDFQQTTARQIAERSIDKFNMTGNNQFQSGIAEYSLNWASPEQEEILRKKLDCISKYANNIDYTLDKYSSSSRWNDFNLSVAWKKSQLSLSPIPKLRIRSDIEVESGKVPPRTGVYVAADAPHVALQFAWHGGGKGCLLQGRTFNYLGEEALAYVGRENLWINHDKMLDFALHKKNDLLVKDDPFYDAAMTRDLAFELVARNSFKPIESKWQYVELIYGEFEDEAPRVQTDNNKDSLRVPGGDICPSSGFYFTPAKSNSRKYFSNGDIMPIFDISYGATIWQWDNKQ